MRLGPAAQLLGFGSYIATCIVGGTVGGHYLDEYFETGRILTMGGLLLGLVLAGFGGYRMITETMADMRRWEARTKKKPK